MIEGYQVVEDCDKIELSDSIMDLVEDGWSPLGGVSALIVTDINGEITTWYHQAMVKYSDGFNHNAARGVTA